MKISIIGAGNVGATGAQIIAEKEICNRLILLDVTKGLAEGKALDLAQTAPLARYTSQIQGVTDDYEATKDSSVVIVTSGKPRKPGMNREDLIKTNGKIVRDVMQKAVKYSPEAVFIIVTNPLDIMAYCALFSTQLPSRRVIGMAGMLDTARYKNFLASELDCSPKDIEAVTLGGHGDTMVPMPRYTSVSGAPLTQLLSEEKINAVIERTRFGGGEIVKLLGTSAWFAPGYAAAKMAVAVAKNQRRFEPASVYLNGEYGYKDIYFGVPVMLGKRGAERVLEIELNDEERKLVDASALKVKESVDVLKSVNLF